MASDLGNKAKTKLREFVPIIDKTLMDVWNNEAEEYFGFNDRQRGLAREIVTHARSHNLAPSKRLRSAFVMHGWLLGQKNQIKMDGLPKKVLQAAAGVELVHTALLMHDDFMDQDQLRRGFETTNAYFAKKYGEHYGDAMAVNTGDVVLCLGFEIFGRCGLEDKLVLQALNHLHRTIMNTAYGQALDVTLGHLNEWSEADVLAVHSAKTGLYTYENPLIVGAILADLSEEAKQILHKYAEVGGVAFQLQDDVLGVFGDPDETGKSADSDLLQGKATLLIHRVKTHGTVEEWKAVEKVWGKMEASRQDLDEAKKALISSGSLDYSKKMAIDLAKKAASEAEKLRKLDLNSEAIDFLQGVAEYMVERKV